MKKKFKRDNNMCLRETRRGETLYSGITIDDPLFIHTIKILCKRTGKSPSKVLKRFVEGAFNAGFTPEM